MNQEVYDRLMELASKWREQESWSGNPEWDQVTEQAREICADDLEELLLNLEGR